MANEGNVFLYTLYPIPVPTPLFSLTVSFQYHVFRHALFIFINLRIFNGRGGGSFQLSFDCWDGSFPLHNGLFIHYQLHECTIGGGDPLQIEDIK